MDNNSQPKAGAKPVTGITGSSSFAPNLYRYDENGRIIENITEGSSPFSKSKTKYTSDPEEARIGDYYYDQNGKLNVVPNSPTDIFNKWKITDDSSLYSKPKKSDYVNFGEALGTTVGSVVGTAVGGAVRGGVPGAVLGGGMAALIAMPAMASTVGAQEKAYKQALKDWQKSQDREIWKLAGDITIGDDGSVYFTPDVKKAITMNIPFSGTEVQNAFNKETDVHFGDDGRLKIDVNPIYATTDEYSQIVDILSQAYAGLTKDTEGVDDYIKEIKDYVDTGNNQFRFREQTLFAYKNVVPGASDAVINDVYTNEVGAYMSEDEAKDWNVKVYRDGKVVDDNAKNVLETFYNKDLGKRSDYMLDLYSKMEDPTLTADQKAYIYGEIRLLQSADSNDQTYDNGTKDSNGATVKTKNKYFGMLDQESIISWANNYNLVTGVSVTDVVNFLNGITPWDMNLNSQEGLQEDPAAASAARIISAATSAYISQMIMQGIEYKIVRPVASAIKGGTDALLEKIAASGGRFSQIVGEAQLTLEAVKDAATSAEVGGIMAGLYQGARVAATPVASAIGFSISELLYNATSDLLFDAGKQAMLAIAGENPTAEDFLSDFGADLLMDVIIQYGPYGLSQLHAEMDNMRIDAAYEPYRLDLEKALSDFDAAELEYNTLKNQLSDMRKGTKKYKALSQEVEEKQKIAEEAKNKYDAKYNETQAAIREALPSLSEQIGAKFAGDLAKVEQTKVVNWLRKKLLDDKTGLSALAEQAYAKTKDVYYYQAAINKIQNINTIMREVSVKMLYADLYSKGTAEAYSNWKNAIATASPNAKFSKSDIYYMVAKARYDMWSDILKNDPTELAKVENKYLPYINGIESGRQAELDEVLETTRAFLAKVGDSYIKSGAATKKQAKDIEAAAFGKGYIPLWGDGSGTKKFGIFETPLTLGVGRNFDKDDGLFDVEGTKNPIESASQYTHNVINNIARNELAGMLRDMASIDGVGIELAGEGGFKGVPKYQDIVDEAVSKIVKSNEELINNEVDPDKYHNKLDKVLAKDKNNAAVKEIDDLIPQQKKLQNLIEKNKSEIDPAKKARRLKQIVKLGSEVNQQKIKLKEDIDTRVRAAADYFNKTYEKFGIKVDVENTLTSAKYVDLISSRLASMSVNDLIALKDDIARIINDVAPFLPIKKINKRAMDDQINIIKQRTNNRIKKEDPKMPAKKRWTIVGEVVDNFKAQVSGDFSALDISDTPSSMSGYYKIPFYMDNQDASFYIKGKMAKEIFSEITTKNVVDKRAVREFLKKAANIKRLLTTGIDPTRVLPNLVRDTIRNGVMSGGTDYWFFDNSPFGFKEMFTSIAKSAGDSDEQIENALKMMQAAQEVAHGSTYNEAINGRRADSVKRLVETSDAVGKNRGTRLVWELLHDKKTLLETPMNWAEGITRDRAASSAFLRAYARGAGVLDYDTRVQNAYNAGLNAGRENTVNFSRRGTSIAELGAYVPYLSQRFSSIESAKISFLKDPIGVSSRIMMFGYAYMMELSRVLADEKSRKNYYNLSEYDRENNIVLSLGGGLLVTIPLDESLAALIYPWRRGLETMHNVDPEDFYMIMVNSLLELSPFDLSGFTEGDSFNFGRGVEKLGAQLLPSILQAAYTQASGRTMYYGSNVAVTADDLAEYGVYNPSAGDFTRASSNSALLRNIANALGIEQWRLQQVIADLGGNVGQYTVNWLDKLSGAPEDAQGGKDFLDSTFKSFTGMDSNQVYYEFNDGIARLQQEKNKVNAKLVELNAQISTASGQRLAYLKTEVKKVKQEFALKVGSFVEKYINAYEIAGGLQKSQANKIWYLLNFSDDNSLAQYGSVESYYRDSAQKQASNDATELSASILDKYYDQTKNVYKGTDGKWHYYSPYGEQAFFNTVYGKGMQYQTDLRNILDGNKSLVNAKSAAYDARSKAADAGDWDEYDRIGLDFDEKVLNAIYRYVNQEGAYNVLTNSKALDYLEEWFFVPSSYMKSKYGKNVSLAHNASKQRAFVRPYIKELFSVSTEYVENENLSKPERLVKGK